LKGDEIGGQFDKKRLEKALFLLTAWGAPTGLTACDDSQLYAS